MTRRVQVEPASRELRIAQRCGRVLSAWFPGHGRAFPWRLWRDPYRLLVVEMLLQRTRADTVARACQPFFDAYPDWSALDQAPVDDLRARLAPLGLSTARTASLKAVAGRMTKGPPLSTFEELPGVGQYIARSVRVITLGSSEAMVDANFVRVIRRVFGGSWMSDYRTDRRLQSLAHAIIKGSPEPRAANWAVLDLGALVCTPRAPRCGGCPLNWTCVTAATHQVHASSHEGST